VTHSRIARLALACFVASGLGLSHPARAADTVEPFDVGVSNLELYTGYDGLGTTFSDQALMGDFLLGIGVLERLSLYLGTTVEGYRRMRAGDGTVNLGVFGTVLDTRHVDIDLVLGLGLGGPGFRGVNVSPAFEINLDREPDLRAYGLYLKGAAVISVSAADPEEGEQAVFLHHYVTTVGAYLTLGPKHRHQLLAEFDVGFHPDAGDPERRVDIGGIAVGYNVVLHERLELITQLCVDIPQGDEKAAVGLLAGIIVTLPTGR
jgi:hypothetical protein